MIRRYGTHVSELSPESIKCIGYKNGAYYVSEYLWQDFAFVLRETPHELTWIGAPGWFALDECKRLYEQLAARYDLTNFHNGEWICTAENSFSVSKA